MFIKDKPCTLNNCTGEFEVLASGRRNCMRCLHNDCPIIKPQRIPVLFRKNTLAVVGIVR